jgi:hypothetical protein
MLNNLSVLTVLFAYGYSYSWWNNLFIYLSLRVRIQSLLTLGEREKINIPKTAL